LKLGSRRRAIKIVYCPWAIRENPASSAANQIARFIKTNACHIIILFIVQLEANQHKAKKLQEHVVSVNDWTTSTTVFLDEFNDIAGQLVPSDASGKDKASDVGETDLTDGQDDAVDGDDVEKAKNEREEKINAANEIVHRIAVSFVEILSVFIQ
jgi:hypothetical protein